MTWQDHRALVMQMEKRRRDIRRLHVFLFCLTLGAQVPGIALAGMISWTYMWSSIASDAVIIAAVWVPIVLVSRKMDRLCNARALISKLLTTMDPADAGEPLARATTGLFIVAFLETFRGSEQRDWKNGMDRFRGHPEDRLDRLGRVMAVAAYRPVPAGVTWQMRLEMIAAVQIAISAEVLHSRSVDGRLRNAWQRVFAKRRELPVMRMQLPVSFG